VLERDHLDPERESTGSMCTITPSQEHTISLQHKQWSQPMSTIAVGKKAPAFNLKDQHGASHRLSQYKGQPVVLFFYPKDMTSGCTREACDFQDLGSRFKKLGAVVLGISIMGTKSKLKFAEKEGLSYPLLADDRENDEGKPDPEVSAKYGVWVEKSMYGKTYMGIERTTYLIDQDGKVAQCWSKVKVPEHAQEVLDAVKALGK
jgi:peroxiredoxin Q/BCP